MRDAVLSVLFDGDKGAVFGVVLIGLLVAGAAVLVVNLTARSRPPPAPKWEAVADDEEATPAETPTRTLPKAAPRRRA